MEPSEFKISVAVKSYDEKTTEKYILNSEGSIGKN